MNAPLLSVLLPVYNAGAPLALAIESIVAQDLRDFEFIIIDDASKDNSAALIERYAKRDARIRFIRHESNNGLAATLNEGLAIAATPFVARMDQDDESLPARLRKQREFMLTHPQVAVCGSNVFHMGSSVRYDRLVSLPSENEEIRTTLTNSNCMYHPAVMLRREQIMALGGYRKEFKNAEDYDLWLRVSRSFALANLTEPLLRYRYSVKGMTLGRKWEQYFYVCLAQVAHDNPAAALETLYEAARQKRNTYQRSWFLEQVYEGTIRDLIALHHWRDALVLSRRRIGDVNLRSGMKSFMNVLTQFGRSFMHHEQIEVPS